MRAPVSVAAAMVAAVACGNSSPPPAPPSAASSAPSAEPSAAPSSSGAAGAASAAPADTAPSEPARRRRPLEIRNSCNTIVTVVFGEDPKADTSGKRTIAANSSVDGPRDAEGKMTVHLLDDKGEKIATVHVTRGMKKVEIGASCRTLDAR